MMGGLASHEYHLPATIGDDLLIQCPSCGYATNKELVGDTDPAACSKCESTKIVQTQGIEVGHTFLLGEKYSKILGANVVLDDGSIEPLIMGCYGIGITRTVAASIEVLSSETEIRWPSALAPFLICIIPPKRGSQEETAGQTITMALYEALNKLPAFNNNVLIDDRFQLTIGKRLMMSKRMGYPIIIVVGNNCINATPTVEVHLTNSATQIDLQPQDLVEQITEMPLS